MYSKVKKKNGDIFMIFFKMFIILFSNLYLSYIQLIYKEIKKGLIMVFIF